MTFRVAFLEDKTIASWFLFPLPCNATISKWWVAALSDARSLKKCYLTCQCSAYRRQMWFPFTLCQRLVPLSFEEAGNIGLSAELNYLCQSLKNGRLRSLSVMKRRPSRNTRAKHQILEGCFCCQTFSVLFSQRAKASKRERGEKWTHSDSWTENKPGKCLRLLKTYQSFFICIMSPSIGVFIVPHIIGKAEWIKVTAGKWWKQVSGLHP